MGRNSYPSETDTSGILMHTWFQMAGLALAVICAGLAAGVWAAGVALGFVITLVSAAVEAGRK